MLGFFPFALVFILFVVILVFPGENFSSILILTNHYQERVLELVHGISVSFTRMRFFSSFRL